MSAVEHKPVPLYWWPVWIFFLALGLFLFYVVLTPVWMGIRLVVWTSERSRPRTWSNRGRTGV